MNELLAEEPVRWAWMAGWEERGEEVKAWTSVSAEGSEKMGRGREREGKDEGRGRRGQRKSRVATMRRVHGM